MEVSVRWSRVAALLAGAVVLATSACQPTPSDPAPTPMAPTMTRAWGRDLPGLAGQPLVSGSSIFVPLRSPNQGEGLAVVALDAATGATRWGPVPVGGLNFDPSLALGGGHLLALNDRGLLRALDPATGAERWQRDLTGYNSSRNDFFRTLVSISGKAYAGSTSTNVVVDAASGAYRWNVYGGDEPAVTSDAAWTGTTCGGGARYAHTSGRALWLRDGECSAVRAGVPTRHYNGRVYIQRGDGVRDDILDAATGQLLGHFQSDQAPVFKGTTAYVVDDGRLQAVDAATGAVGWTAPGDGMLDSAPLLVGNEVFAVSATGAVFAFDASNGTARRIDDLGQRWLPSRHGEHAPVPRLTILGDGVLATASSRLVRLLPASVATARRPGAPVDVFATAGDGTATVTWTAPADAGAAPRTGYTVRETSTGRTVTVPAGATTTMITGLPNGRALRFTVAATNRVGAGPASALSPAVTAHAGAWLLVPMAIAPGAVGSDGEDVNAAGTAVGTTRFGVSANHAWNRATAWAPSGAADVGLGLGRRDSHALVVGPTGDVVGTAWHGRDDGTCPQEHCAFLVRNGTRTTLSGFTEVRDIDGTGRIVGWGEGVARWWLDGRYQSLAGTMANGTNDAGVAVGQDFDGWAVTWRGTTATRLPRPWCSVTSTANAVNSTGQAVGVYDACGDGYWAALWRNGQFVALPNVFPGAAEAFDINAAGDAVGHNWDMFVEVATLWHGGQVTDLNRYVAPEAGWRLIRATGIADDGSIVGTGLFRGRGQAFVLRPPGAQG